jgi:transcriptional regulator with XRE-family HTH domain
MPQQIDNIYEIAEFVKQVRLDKNLTQTDVAILTGVERAWINRLENGKIEGVTLLTLYKLIHGLKYKLLFNPIKA